MRRLRQRSGFIAPLPFLFVKRQPHPEGTVRSAEALGVEPFTLRNWFDREVVPVERVTAKGKKPLLRAPPDIIARLAPRNRSAFLGSVTGAALVPMDAAPVISGLPMERILEEFHAGNLDWFVSGTTGLSFRQEQLARLPGAKPRVLLRHAARLAEESESSMLRWVRRGWIPAETSKTAGGFTFVHIPAGVMRAIASRNVGYLRGRVPKEKLVSLEMAPKIFGVSQDVILDAFRNGKLRWMKAPQGAHGPLLFVEDVRKELPLLRQMTRAENLRQADELAQDLSSLTAKIKGMRMAKQKPEIARLSSAMEEIASKKAHFERRTAQMDELAQGLASLRDEMRSIPARRFSKVGGKRLNPELGEFIVSRMKPGAELTGAASKKMAEMSADEAQALAMLYGRTLSQLSDDVNAARKTGRTDAVRALSLLTVDANAAFYRYVNFLASHYHITFNPHFGTFQRPRR